MRSFIKSRPNIRMTCLADIAANLAVRGRERGAPGYKRKESPPVITQVHGERQSRAAARQLPVARQERSKQLFNLAPPGRDGWNIPAFSVFDANRSPLRIRLPASPAMTLTAL
jgi:hypothetical protein